MRFTTGLLLTVVLATTALLSASAAPKATGSYVYIIRRSGEVDPSLFQDLHWRSIGPFRGGRVLAVEGVVGQPLHFYFGAVNGGVWETKDAGRTWAPIFDGEGVGSIGAIAVARANPKIVYVGTGEADMRSDIAQGIGMFKSTDGGAHWASIGLADTQQIGKILVDPKNPNIVLVAALGHPYGPNTDRGVFRSTDGGKTWAKTLFKNADTGAIDMAFQPGNSNIVYAALWQTRRPPWNIYPPSNGPGSGLYKSKDGGKNWVQLTSKNLPADPGRIGIAVSPQKPNRVYALIDAKDGGLYRSDDAGATWAKMTDDKRIWERGWYFAGVTANPKNADDVYVCDTIVLRSTDGGKHFIPLKGDQTGDDFHSLWIDPTNADRRILGVDQGTLVTLNGGATWSTWFNQPTGQFYHVVTDNRFPYWVYGAQQDSGAAGVPSRTGSIDGIAMPQFHEITAGGESDNIAPDPDDPDTVYGGRVDKLDLRDEQVRSVDPTLAFPDAYRGTWTLPLIFGPRDHALYFGNQRIFKTTDGGEHWNPISPDLTRPNPGVPSTLDAATIADEQRIGPRRGVVYTIAPSPRDAKLIWAGTDDGLVWRTNDGGAHWQNVTPQGLAAWSKIGGIDPSHFNSDTAYIAIDRHRLDDFKPYVMKTKDGGKTWTAISNGIANGSVLNAVNVVREDPVKPGLLFAGTERGAFVSFDDGADWQPLQSGLPPTSVRDMQIHGDDLVIATHGRSFYVLDDIEPLRELAGGQVPISGLAPMPHLFTPAVAIRTRPASFTGTPMPKDEPMAPNPPNGAYIDYILPAGAKGAVTITILDAKGAIVRSYSSDEKNPPPDLSKLPIAPEWLPQQIGVSAAAGEHRFVWDFHYAAPPELSESGRHGRPSPGVWAPPGNYTVVLKANGQELRAPLTVQPDPRVKAPPQSYAQAYALARQIETALVEIHAALKDVHALHASLQKKEATAQGGQKAQIAGLDAKLVALADLDPEDARSSVPKSARPPASLNALSSAFDALGNAVDGADGAPTADAVSGFNIHTQLLTGTLRQWTALKAQIAAVK